MIVLDGATGTELGRRGVDTRTPLFSAAALLDAKGRQTLLEVHRDYVRAGAQVVTANTFRTNPRKAGPRWRELTRDALRIARDSGAQVVAGSMAPVEDCYLPQLRPPPDVALAEHRQMAQELAKGRDLSPQAHRDVWVSLFSRADRVAPGISRALYDRVMDPLSWVPFADTRPTLEALRDRRRKVGVVSNVPRDLRPVFAAHGLGDLVDAFTHSFEVGAEKPDPAIFRAACRALGTAPGATLMVGDHPAADGGAERAGMRVFILPAEFDGEVRGLARVLDLLA
jgi:putative hydrolase of the HAD superfamily